MTERAPALAKLSIKGVFWTALSMGALGVAEVVSLIVLARLLSPEDFGLYAGALIIVRFSAVFGGLGVAPAIVQRPVIEERHLRVGFTLSLLFSLCVAGLVWAIAPVLSVALNLPGLTPIVRGISFVFLFQSLALVAQASAQRRLRFRWLAAVDASAFAVGFVVVGPIMAILDFGAWALVGALVTQHAVRMITLLAGQPHPKRPMLETAAARDLLYFGGGFTIAKTFNYLASQADKLVVGRWLGAGTLGVYSLVSLMMTAPSMIVGNVLDRVLFPAMALVQSEPARLARAYRTGVGACALLMLPTGTVLVILAPELIMVLLGSGWSEGVLPLQILAAGMLFRTSYKLSDSVARATGAVYRRAWRQTVYCGGVIAGALVGQFWGLPGVATGVVLALTANFMLMAHLSLSLTGLRWSEFGRAHLPGLAQAVVLGVSVWLLADKLRELGVQPFLVLLDAALVATAISMILCWILPGVFLGRDGQSVLRTTASLLPARGGRSRVG